MWETFVSSANTSHVVRAYTSTTCEVLIKCFLRIPNENE